MVSVQIEKHDGAGSDRRCYVSCCEAETSSTPLDGNNFKFALHLQQGDRQPQSSELSQ